MSGISRWPHDWCGNHLCSSKGNLPGLPLASANLILYIHKISTFRLLANHTFISYSLFVNPLQFNPFSVALHCSQCDESLDSCRWIRDAITSSGVVFL